MASAFLCEEVPAALECRACGTQFLFNRSSRGRPRKYCSDECRPTHRERAKERYKAKASSRQPREAHCCDCGCEFVTFVGSKASTCKACIQKRGRAASAAIANARRTRACQQCGVEYRAGSLSSKQKAEGHVQRYCSRACYADSIRVYATKADEAKAYEDRKRARLGLPPVIRATERLCVECGATFKAKAVGLVKCIRCRHVVPRVTKPCEDCGGDVTGTAAKRRCRACARKRGKRADKEKYGSMKNHRQRARKFCVQYEPVSPNAIFDRDGWKCQICGVKTPKRLRGSYDDRAPELDHRVPMAKGGAHTYANVQCACRRCNLAKGANDEIGQINMFPVHRIGGGAV